MEVAPRQVFRDAIIACKPPARVRSLELKKSGQRPTGRMDYSQQCTLYPSPYCTVPYDGTSNEDRGTVRPRYPDDNPSDSQSQASKQKQTGPAYRNISHIVSRALLFVCLDFTSSLMLIADAYTAVDATQQPLQTTNLKQHRTEDMLTYISQIFIGSSL